MASFRKHQNLVSRRGVLLAAAAGLTASACTSEAFSYSFADEFDGPAGSAPNPSKWAYDLGGHGWGNRELQTYTDSRANSFLDGHGHLVIRVTKRGGTYQSARLKTAGRFSQYRGTFEARVKLGIQPGLWPAWWAMGGKGWPQSGEVDMLENYGQRFAESTVWTPNRARTGMGQNKYARVPADNGWHIWRMRWDGGGFTFSKDGVKYLTVTAAQLPNWCYGSGDALFMLLNVAVGGLAGTPPASVRFPVDAMIVDWVRVWR